MRSREDNAIFTNIPIEDIEFYEQTNDELQQENKQLQQELDKYKHIVEEIKKFVKVEYFDSYVYGTHILNKIEELERNNEND